MSSEELFPHLGMRVPLNYIMVERCMRQVRAIWAGSVIDNTVETVSEDQNRTSDSKAAATAQNSDEVRMADWERVCEAYHARRVRESREQ
eukprot:2945255-Rhodomonas_salina.1